MPPALEAQSPNHWTTREVPTHTHFQWLLGLWLRAWFSLNSFDLESSDKVDSGGVGEFGTSSWFCSDGKESACSVEDLGSIPGLRRSPGEGNGNPLQYSCLGNPMDRGVWIAHGVTKSQTRQSDWHFHFPDLNSITCGRSDFGRGRGSPVSTIGTMSHIPGHVFPLLKTHPCFPVVVQLLSCVWLFVTPWTVVRQASLSFTIFQSLLKLMSIESKMPSNHLILCHPLLLLLSNFPRSRVFFMSWLVCIRWSKYWSFSFSWILASHSGPLWSGPCLSSVSSGLFNCTCLVVLFIQKTIFHPLYCLCPFIKDELTTFTWVCLYALCSDLLIYLSIPSSIIHCLDYCSFTILSLPIHEHGISLHLFSSLISFIRLCSFPLIDLFFPIILLW